MAILDYLIFILTLLVLLPGWPPHTRQIIQYSSSIQDGHCTPDRLFAIHPRFTHPQSRMATMHQLIIFIHPHFACPPSRMATAHQTSICYSSSLCSSSVQDGHCAPTDYYYSSLLRPSSFQDGHHTPDRLFIIHPCTYSSSFQNGHHRPDRLFVIYPSSRMATTDTSCVIHSHFTHPPSRMVTPFSQIYQTKPEVVHPVDCTRLPRMSGRFIYVLTSLILDSWNISGQLLIS